MKFEEPKPILNSSSHVMKMITLRPARRLSREQIPSEPELQPFSKPSYEFQTKNIAWDPKSSQSLCKYFLAGFESCSAHQS